MAAASCKILDRETNSQYGYNDKQDSCKTIDRQTDRQTHSQFRGCRKLQDVAAIDVEQVEEQVLLVPVELDRRQLLSDVNVRQVLVRHVVVCAAAAAT